MLEPDNSLYDSVDAALGVLGQPTADDNLRETLLAQTLGVVRRRRWMKRCILAAVLLGCYLAGITTVGLWRSQGNVSPQSPSCQPMIVAQTPRNVTPPPLPVSAGPVKRQAAAAKSSGFEAWRRIGDHYLRETGDISLAVAGYSEAVNLASEEELAISPGRDNWILMALKDARTKERNHAFSEQN